MLSFIRAAFILLSLTGIANAAPRSLVEMTGFSYYLGCNPSIPSCWATMPSPAFYNILNIGTNTKPVVIRDDLAEMNIVTGGFTPQASGIYEARLLMEGAAGTVGGPAPGYAFDPRPQTLLVCGWHTYADPATGTPITQQSMTYAMPPNSIVMIEQQHSGFWSNSHMTPLIMPLTGGVTYYMTCWASAPWLFNNLTTQSGGVWTPIPVVDFIINRID